jgi:hypothetical protein
MTAFLWIVNLHFFFSSWWFTLACTWLIGSISIGLVLETFNHMFYNFYECNIIITLTLRYFTDMNLHVLNAFNKILCHQLTELTILLHKLFHLHSKFFFNFLLNLVQIYLNLFFKIHRDQKWDYRHKSFCINSLIIFLHFFCRLLNWLCYIFVVYTYHEI